MPISLFMNEYFEPWLKFKQPSVRQLAFCLASPNIIKSIPDELSINYNFDLHMPHFWQTQFIAYQQRLLRLDQHPEPLFDFLNQLKSTRLGLRFEYLLWFWLQDHEYHPYQLLGHSIQKIDHAKTLGELDFLLLNTNTNEIEHWEVALKYYLGEADFTLPFWFGLNRDDTLSKKLNHFTQRQFQFKQVDHHVIQKRYAVLKGQLYLPESFLETTMNLDWIEPQRQLGQWGSQIRPDYYRLTRHEWLCPNHVPSSSQAKWWTNGLYKGPYHFAQYYMYRQHLMTYK
ncbi:DUF1853 family protein [Acinetobacter sp. S40]|uniref:DUF1853 family protein n=1 Tax=Acinetobacter sp. S40 TaxID=2767434 RepID=UPI00190AC484|nr:DUF1853 family protein [Acinetobacter sp. S40]MBJ9986262.1 DUF1853 family protein [Acinetobacter sp. S40]